MTLEKKGNYCHIVGCAILQSNLKMKSRWEEEERSEEGEISSEKGGRAKEEKEEEGGRKEEGNQEKKEEGGKGKEKEERERREEEKERRMDEGGGKWKEKEGERREEEEQRMESHCRTEDNWRTEEQRKTEERERKEEKEKEERRMEEEESIMKGIYWKVLEQSEQNLKKNNNLRKLMQNFSRFLGVGFWKKFGGFNIKDHIEYLEVRKSQDEIYEFMNQHANQTAFEPNRPKWKVFIFKDLINRDILVWKLHHSLGDGISIISAMLYLGNCKNLKTVRITKPKSSIKGIFLGIPQIFSFFANLLILPVARTLMDCHQSKGEILCYRSENLDLRELKYFARTNKLLLNDVIITLISSTFHKFYQQKFKEKLEYLKIFIAASLRKIPQEPGSLPLSNEINFFVQKLEEKEPQPQYKNQKIKVKRVSEERAVLESNFLKQALCYNFELNKLKSSLVLIFQSFLTKFIYSFLPIFCTQFLINLVTKKIFVVFSSLPGPIEKIKLYGKEVEEVFFFVNGLQNMRIMLNVMSYDGKIHLGVTSDSGSGVEAKEFVKMFEEVYREEITDRVRC